MARKKAPDDQPDAVVYSDQGGTWGVLCTLCPRTLTREWSGSGAAREHATEHLRHTHGLDRVWIDQHRPGYRQAVQMALPLIVEHDLTLTSDIR